MESVAPARHTEIACNANNPYGHLFCGLTNSLGVASAATSTSRWKLVEGVPGRE